MRFTMPTGAVALLVVIIPASMFVGGAIGSWLVPLALAVLRDGIDGPAQIPIEWGVIANLPIWLDPESGRPWYTIAGIASMIVCIAGAGVLGLLGGRLWGWLVVKKFRWMTEEEVREFSKRDPGI